MALNPDANYKKVFIAFQLSERANRLLSESAKRSNRRKLQEAALRLEDHLNQVFSISHVGSVSLSPSITEEGEL